MMILFEKKGIENTIEALNMAINEAIKRDTDLVLATTTGYSAIEAMKLKKEKGMTQNIIVVSHAYGFRNPGENTLKDETRKELEDNGIVVVTASHVLSGIERGINNRYQGAYPALIMADTLRMFSQGIKVCVEISVMALDAGKIKHGKPVVCVGGTGRGTDTIAIVSPAHANHILDTKIHEIIAMPSTY